MQAPFMDQLLYEGVITKRQFSIFVTNKMNNEQRMLNTTTPLNSIITLGGYDDGKYALPGANVSWSPLISRDSSGKALQWGV